MSGIIISSLMLLILETRLPGVTSSNIYNGNNVISDFALPPSHPYCSNQSNHEDLTRLGVVPGEAEQTSRSKVEVFGEILKRHVHELRRTANRKVELVFLVDSSASVGSEEFLNELKFVKKLLADFTVDRHTTRVSVVTFSSRSRVIRHIDHLTHSRDENHKCSLLEEELPKIEYSGGGTYTLGAMLEAEKVFRFARLDAKKALFLITDGYSNGGDPRPAAEALKRQGVEIFTFGIRQGNFVELCEMASEKKEEHTYILNTFEEFEVLARRALHEDLHVGNYIIQNSNKCNGLCDERKDCCDSLATCRCGTHTGKYECICQTGYYGNGLKKGCTACPEGTYKNYTGPGDKSTCLACPDPNHLSPAGSTDIDQCQCRKGYRAIGLQACAAKTCPDLTLPDNGYFVQGQCNNDVNAACGIRCKSGYTLHGSSLRLCTEDGTWTGSDVSCEVKRCPRLRAPDHGELDCTKADFSFDTHCNFRCREGYRLVGSKSQSCLAIALWSGIPPKCREVKCPELPSLTDGKVTPETCTSTESSFGTVCQFVCRKGYKMVGSHSKQCMENGKWSPDDGSDGMCVDITPPVITCPNNITGEASEDENVGAVWWEIPAAVDNSGFLPTVTVVPALIPPVSVPIGENLITYTAEDSNKNKAKCSFSIIIRDTQAPRVDKCISPPPFMRRNKGMEITWEEPIFSDNSFAAVHITKSHKPGVFPLGTTQVTYVAYDKDNNTAKCVIEITVQEHACANHPVPLNGDLDCQPEGNGISCSPSCNKGFGFAIIPSNKYFCDYNVGEWVPGNKWPIKDCSVSKKTNHVKQTVDMQFKLKSNCKDRLILLQLENGVQTKIKNKTTGYCQPNMICDAGQFETTCVDEEDIDNKIGVLNNFGHENAALMSSDVVLERPRRSAPVGRRIGVEYQRDGAASGIQAKSTVSIKYDIIGFSDLTQHHEDIQSGVTFVMKKIIEDARNGEFDSIFLDDDMEVLVVDYINRPPEFLCQQGSVLIDFECVRCPGGTFFNVVREACEGCQKGTYQPEEGQLTCLVCPNNMSTAQNNSRSVQQCRGQCLPGSFSLDGVEWCETCPNGFYQPSYAQSMCLPCPAGTTTWRRGSRKLEDCGTECKEGYVSKTGLEPCFPCPRGYFQPERGRSSCFLCPDGVKTRSPGSTDITDCEGISESAASHSLNSSIELSMTECFSLPCQNDAECVSVPAGYTCKCQSGWTGMHCEIEVDECVSNPCQNNGTCLDEMNGYNCTCHPGYSGIHCEVNIDECASDPCLNNATCVDHIDDYLCECVAGFNGTHCEENIDDCVEVSCKNGGSCIDGVAEFKCECAVGFQGSNCEFDIDECTSVPCQNNATCIDGYNSFSCLCKAGYIGAVCEYDVNECESSPCQNGATCLDLVARYLCKCPPSFSGVNCETQLNSTFDFDFPTSGITDYVAIEDPFGNRNLSAFTIAMWIKTDDRESQGTPLSYATDTDDNALVITDYSGFVVYINGKIQHTDVEVNDGKWHHIALTWSNQNGILEIFKDGLNTSEFGFEVKSGTTIQGGGVLVIGQEQDSRGGRFSISESFVGRISKLNIWDFALSAEKIRELTTTCDDYIGNLIAWPDFLGGINGRVQKLDTDICKGCNKPLEVSHGVVSWNATGINATAAYSCDLGYEINGPPERICLVDSTWSGIEPRCTKVFCGFPGNIRNGLIMDSYYSYGNTIRYACSSGYKLVGNRSRYCNASAQWEGEEPECLEIFCILPPLMSSLRIISSKVTDFKPGDVVRFNCSAGHRLSGQRNVRCNMTGGWENSLPECREIRCGSPPEIANGRALAERNDTFPINSLVRLECETGFNISNGGHIRCGESGNWTFNNELTIPSCLPRRCQRLTSPLNGFVDGHLHPVYQTTVSYRCEIGYILFGTAERTCQADSTWSGEAPSCNPIGCPPPGDILHGRMLGAEFFYKGRVIYYCDPGYVLYGSAERHCGADGTWSSSVPTCDPIKCPDPGTIAHGHIFGSVYTLDSVIEFACDSGFQLVGAKQQKCLANGTWSATRPTCEKVLCPEPLPLAHGRFEASSYETGSVVKYTCEKGYEVEGKDTRSCRLDGTWTGPTPKCNAIQCLLPVSIKHGSFVADETTLGSTIKYLCEHGYVLDGPSNRTCTDGKEWTGTDPSCLEVSCEKPNGIAYGSVNGDNYRIGSSVFYKCEPGYELKGSATRFCVVGKIWNGTEPQCKVVECDKPSPVISNGRMISTNFSYTSTIHYVCDDGYYMDGTTSRTCKADGTWMNSIPVCERVECPRPTRPPNCEVDGINYKFKEKLRYTCRTGYQLVGPNERVCQADKTWSGGEPRCVQIECSRPANITNGRIVLQGLYYKNVAFYQCHSRFWLKGTEKRECTENGTWSGVEPTCTEVMCGKAPLIDYGRPINDQITAGMTVEYQCDEGYHLVQSAKLTCSLQGNYSGNKPRCIKVQCPKPQPIDHGKLDANDIILGSVLRYTCDTGFKIEGPSERLCGEDSQWSGVDPICVVVNCGPPDYVPDTFSFSTTYEYGAVVTFSCSEGFLLESGDLNRTCLAEEKWSGEPPVCKKVACPRPAIPYGFIAIAAGENRIERHVQEIDRFVHGITVEFDCEDGYVLKGVRELSCLINGSWNGLIPSCKRISCPAPNITNSIILSPRGFEYGFRTLVSCVEGYELSGSMELNCLANGSWSAEFPTCLAVTCEDPPNIDNVALQIIDSPNQGFGYPFGIVIGLQCDEGFELIGASTVKCLSTRQWSSLFPTCQQIQCSPPLIEGNAIPLLENSKDVYAFAEKLRFKCGADYELIGNKEISCNENKTWNGTVPRCQLSVCPSLNIPHAILNGSSFLFGIGTVLSVECKDGHRLLGNSSLKCLPTKLWSAEAPKCIEVNCLLPLIPNADGISENKSENVSAGKQVIFKCKPGFKLSGASNALCLKSGNWSVPVPQCITVTCPSFSVDGGQVVVRRQGSIVSNVLPPPVVVEAALSRREPEKLKNNSTYQYGDVVEVVCETGFALTGNSSNITLVCEASGSWSGRIPTCEKLLCPEPYVKNAQAKMVEDLEEANPTYSFGALITFTCDKGYNLVGEADNICLGDGTWSEPYPNCELIHCPELEIANANISSSNTSYGTEVSVSCLAGFELFGDALLVCRANGVWSGLTPICLKVACKIPEIAFARLISKSALVSTVSYGDQIKVECHEGFRMVGKAEVTCGFNKKWSPEVPMCERKYCPSLNLNVTHLMHKISDGSSPNADRTLPFGTEVSFECKLGYHLDGKSSIRCESNQSWSSSVPNCSLVFCPEPFLENGYFKASSVINSYTFGQNLRFRCNPGFQMIGEAEMFCQPNGEWTEEFPICVRQSCPEIPQIPNALAVGNSTLFEAVVEYQCDVGYDLDGHNNVTCLANQMWSIRPSCQRVKCPLPKSLSNGEYLANGFLFENVLRYACNRGYELQGQTDHVCLASGQWSGEVPVCEKVNCSRPPFVPHANIVGDSFVFGDTLLVNCHEGYRLSGSGSIECLWNKTWSRVLGSCKIVTCGEPPFVRFTEPVSGRREFNSTVNYVCNVGYEIQGTVETTCLANGSWTYVNAKCSRVQCPLPNITHHGLLDIHGLRYHVISELRNHPGFSYEARIMHACEKGYELLGRALQVCMPDGQWNGTLPKCEPVECSRPPTLLNAHYAEILRSTYTFGQTLTVLCDTGYLQKGLKAVMCQYDRTWNTSGISCEKVKCPVPGFFQNGGVRGVDFTYGGQISYSCLEGYTLTGLKTRFCGDNGKWNGSEPSCIRITCPQQDIIENGYVEGKDYSYQAVRIYHCDTGYRLSGDSRRTCQSDGQWSGRSARCTIQSCDAPERPEHGVVITNSTTYLSVAEYQCYTGYEIYGEKYRMCDHHGWWTGFTPTCVMITCVEPPSLLNGLAQWYSKSFGSVVRYTCDNKYALVGKAERKCQADRMWSEEAPSCRLKLCPDPVVQSNVRFSGSDFTVGSTIEFSCTHGFTVVGKRFLTCRGDETWNGLFPECERISCKAPPPIANALATGESHKYGDIIRYTCVNGYRLQGSPLISCEASGLWSNATAVCNPVSCGAPPLVKNAKSVNNGLHFGEIVYYLCNEGYDLNGNNLIECSADGVWTGSLPHCELVTCGVVPVIPYASTIVHRTTYGSKASYECNRGYVLQGSSVVECKANGTWAYENRPTCVPVQCGEPHTIQNGGVRAPDKVYNGVATYFCLEGFRLSGNPVIHCEEDGQWSSSRPTCDPIVCSSPDTIPNGNIFGNDYSFGHSVLYSCKVGYIIVGDSIRICQPDGIWSGQTPKCELIYCGLPESPENGNMNFTGLHFGSEVKYWCLFGYSLDGADTATCDSDGNWTNPVPLCLAIGPKKECLPLPAVDNSIEISEKFIVGDSVTIQCKEGFTPAGSLQVTCQDDLTWIGLQGTCQKVTCHIPRQNSMVVIHGYNFKYGDRTAYACRQGLIPATDPVITCMANGQWNKVPECRATCKFECRNGGTCIGPNKCKCPHGYGGRFCETANCILPCMNGGQCVGPYKCKCPYGYGGDRCELPICVKPCQNGGRCVMANRCICPHGFVPPFCESSRYVQQHSGGRR